MPEPVAFAEVTAPASWRCIDFISDLHLADDTPRGFAAWSTYLQTTSADAVVILGDLFAAWVGDDARLGGFEARCHDALRAASARRAVAFMVGNRDFLVGDEMLDSCGVTALADPTVLSAFGERVLLTHGDALCIDDVAYQHVRAMVRQPAWQAGMLARPLAERRLIAKQMRAESEQHQRGAGESVDVDAPTALSWLRAGEASTLIHGHTHRPASELLAPGFTRHVLSDWELDGGGADRVEILRWQPAGLRRIGLDAASLDAAPVPL